MNVTTTLNPTTNVSSLRSHTKKIGNALACLGIYIMALMIPFSHFLVNQAAVLTVLGVLLSGDYREKWKRICHYRSFLWMALFIIFMGIAVIYSSAPAHKALSVYTKYTKLFYILFFMQVFAENNILKKVVVCFVISMVLATGISYLFYFNWIDFSSLPLSAKFFPYQGYGLFVNLLTFSVLQAFCCYLLLVNFLNRPSRYYILLPLLLVLINLIVFNGERSGMLSIVVLLVYAIFFQTQLTWKKKSLLVLFGMVGLSVLLLFSGRLLQKIHMLFYSVSHQAAYTTHLSSAGSRIAFARGSIQIIKKNPLWGTGTGSFANEYTKIKGLQLDYSSPMQEPNNEILHIAVQSGLFGLVLFLIFLYVLYKNFRKLDLETGGVGIATIVAFVIDCLCQTSISVTPTILLFILFFSRSLGGRFSVD